MNGKKKTKPAKDLYGVYKQLGGNTTIRTSIRPNIDKWRKRITREYQWRE